jgi:glycosyltransferase involved in cell wall biosynthesis
MRVLWVHNSPPRVESACVFVFILAEEMRRQGVQVDLYSTGSLRSVVRLMAARREVTRLSRQYDIVHAQFGSACACVSAGALCHRIVTLRGTELLGCDTGPLWYRLHGAAARKMTGVSLPYFERVVVMSHRMREELRCYHGRQAGVEILPCGIDLTRFYPRERSTAREALGYAGDKRPWVLFASMRANNPVKRPKLALKAFQRAAAARPDLVLKTVNGRPHHEIPIWMSAANVILMTSTREGWPNVVKEALACNVPFVSTDVSDLRMIAAVEPSCIVVDPSPQLLAQGILEAIDTLPAAPLRTHVEAMALPRVAERLIELYETTLAAPRGLAA